MIDLTPYWPLLGAFAVTVWWWIAWTRRHPRFPGARKPTSWMQSHTRGEPQ